ncbi:MAG: hypothetical protein ACKN9I_00865, partial [Alphaproteobacteria bacterium]
MSQNNEDSSNPQNQDIRGSEINNGAVYSKTKKNYYFLKFFTLLLIILILLFFNKNLQNNS